MCGALAGCEEKPKPSAPSPAPTSAPAPTTPKPAEPKPPEPAPAATGAPQAEAVLKRTETDSGLIIEDLRYGTGEEVKPHAHVLMHYRGTLADGTEFDSSYKRNEPTAFSLDGVIKGWGEGVPGMKVGGKRRLIIPPELGYAGREIKGPNNQVLIPANSMLIFEMELVEVRK
jgi:FKBP-type peptidyl-prolyl cis-trans isomerase